MNKYLHKSLPLLLFGLLFVSAQNPYGYGQTIPRQAVDGYDRYGREVYPDSYARVGGYDPRLGAYGRPDEYRTGELGLNRDPYVNTAGAYGRRYDGMQPVIGAQEPGAYGRGIRGYGSESTAYRSGYGGYGIGPRDRYNDFRSGYGGNGIGPRFAYYRSGTERSGSHLSIIILTGFFITILHFIHY